LIKNRESAQASRQRKKSYIQDLERKVNELVNENAQLKETVSSLASEKNSLEVLLQQAMSDNKNGVNLSHDVFKVLSKKNDEVTLKTPSSTNNNNTVIVLFLLFSFGLLFCQAAHSKNFPVINPDRNSEMVEYKKNQKPEIKVPSRVSGEVVDASSRPEEEIPSLRLKKTNNRVRKHETRSSRGTKRTRDEALPQPNKIQKKQTTLQNPHKLTSPKCQLSFVLKLPTGNQTQHIYCVQTFHKFFLHLPQAWKTPTLP